MLSQWTFDARGPTSCLGGLTPISPGQSELGKDSNDQKQSIRTSSRGIIERFRFGLSISLQSRFPGTKWSVKNVPPFSRKDPGYVPSKARFLACNMLKCSAYIFILRLSSKLSKPAESPMLFTSSRICLFTRLTDISASELKIRLLGVLGYWTVQYLVIEVLFSILATLAVALYLMNVDVWPPVFGSISEAWSLRQFWR